jgi:hypothetical protein
MASMSPAERIQLCDQVVAEKRTLGPPLDTVRRIDASLRTSWGMALAARGLSRFLCL